MGVTTFTQEFVTPVSPARMFKALVVDSHILVPRLVPESVKSIEFVEGDGGAGSITQTNFSGDSDCEYLKYKINAVDKEKLECRYTLIEGGVLGDQLESIVYEMKFEESGDGGCICKTRSEYHTKGEFEIKEESIREGKEKAMGVYKLVEAYLLANPDEEL
ncbi:hypothetical protein VitviT2T_006069 [Vitis vinifera]|uniref:Pathogenesis-related protein STH-2 n=2 Tax=Vitis vinifera TaxID=29760 RepID=D7SY73_VITVI|eukprot:XP_002271428.2 PREDICTED: pathogenesis-related protein STH-2 [Vitis vinifera]